MSKHKVDEIRNVAFVGHGHSGKTTLADLLLFKSGIGNRAGSVDDGTSLLDTDRRSLDHNSEREVGRYHQRSQYAPRLYGRNGSFAEKLHGCQSARAIGRDDELRSCVDEPHRRTRLLHARAKPLRSRPVQRATVDHRVSQLT